MVAIVFPVSSAPGVVGQEGSGRLVNCYAVKAEQGAPTPIRWQRSAGLREILTITGHSHCRGSILVGSTLLAILDERVYAIVQSGTSFLATSLGNISGSDSVTIARNNAATPDIVLVCDDGVFNLFTGSAPTAFADGDLPSVNSVAAANGYFVFTTGGGQIWSSDLNSVDVGTDSFTAAQANPDGLLRGVWFGGEYYAMGAKTIEVYDETGDTPFPFQFKKITIPRGLVGTFAVAGWEEGWANELLWVGEDNCVYKLDGYTPIVISNDDVSRAIANASDRSLIVASVYMVGKHAFWQITSPGEWTWEYNVTEGAWNERTSKDRSDCRLRCSVRAFDSWIAGDASTGKFSIIDPDYRLEYGDPLVWEIRSGANLHFPYPIEVPSAFFNFTAAAGIASGSDPIETAPRVMVSWSLDGGYTWGNELQRELGRQGAGGKLVRVNAVGTTRSRGIRWRLRVSDPVYVSFSGGEMPDVAARVA